jgi:hypothetical protein
MHASHADVLRQQTAAEVRTGAGGHLDAAKRHSQAFAAAYNAYTTTATTNSDDSSSSSAVAAPVPPCRLAQHLAKQSLSLLKAVQLEAAADAEAAAEDDVSADVFSASAQQRLQQRQQQRELRAAERSALLHTALSCATAALGLDECCAAAWGARGSVRKLQGDAPQALHYLVRAFVLDAGGGWSTAEEQVSVHTFANFHKVL